MPYGYVNCPQCGLKSNLRESSVGTMRKCQNCGHKFIITQKPFSWGSCVIGLLAICGVGAVVVMGCCGLGMIGTSGRPSARVAPPPSAPATNPPAPQVAVTPPNAEMPSAAPTGKPAIPEPEPAKPVEPANPVEKVFDPLAISLSAEETTDRTRTFKSTDGKFSVEAVLLAMRDEVAHLKRVDNGNVIEVPMAKLANSDRIWIRKIAAADKIRNRY